MTFDHDTYKLVCDYDGTVDFDGTDRELVIYPTNLDVSDYDNMGEVFERGDMPWDTDKVIGSIEYRNANLVFDFELMLKTENEIRLLESWCLKFPELWQPSRPFDYVGYYDNSVPSYTAMYQKPNLTSTATEAFADTNDRVYIGSRTKPFSSLDYYLTQVASGGTLVWEYSTGIGTWSTLTVTNGTFTSGAKASWTPPTDWVRVTYTSMHADALYWVRCRASVVPTTNPKILFIKRHRPISFYIMIGKKGEEAYEFWYKDAVSTNYFPNGFCIASMTRYLTGGAPDFYSANIRLLEANY